MNAREFILEVEGDRMRALAFITRLVLSVKPAWEIVVRPFSPKRSSIQNRRYWTVLREISEGLVLDGKVFSDETLHEHFKRLFIGCREVCFPDGTSQVYGISTTELKVGEFAEYMTKIDAWAVEHDVIFRETREYMIEWAERARKYAAREEVAA